MKKEIPSMDAWLKEAKAHESAPKIGMYLTHNGIVRQTAKAKVRYGAENTKDVTGMVFSYDKDKVNAVIADTYKKEGIYYIKVWLNEGQLQTGDDITPAAAEKHFIKSRNAMERSCSMTADFTIR